eukprot:TRINITY_DN14781_c0_g1_i1.p1 TRINITY_DN14781_c0_g1~~TRINITY_DN14781_c0_g1_i1.p1  ORF type:complete len:251 (+),score=80.72 TRINITY_DN14781_c0_g1_i1:91-843(+)
MSASLWDYFTGNDRRTYEVVQDKQLYDMGCDSQRIDLAMTKLSEEGRDFEMLYGPISEADYQKAIANRTPEEIEWEQRAAWNFYPVLAAGLLGGAAVGAGGGKLYVQSLVASRRWTVRKAGNALMKDPVVQAVSWVDKAAERRKMYAMGALVGAFVGGTYAFRTGYPKYLEEVISMPNSQMALALKRMHRQYELVENTELVPVDDSQLRYTETEFESKKTREGAAVPTELAAGSALVSGLGGGGYKAGGS